MPRVAANKKKKPLRASVRQNTVAEDEDGKPWYRIELSFGMRLTLVVVAAFLVIGLVALAWSSGWAHRQKQNMVESAVDLTARANFAIRDISVEGRFYTDRDVLLMALGARAGAPIVNFDPTKAIERVQRLPWIATATITRILPDKIIVRLKERQPMARWQHENRTLVIDTEGQSIRDASPDSFAYLPLVVGRDAPEKTSEFLGYMKNFPAFTKIMKAAVRVGERRWDLYLHPKTIIRLPEKDVVAALMRLEQIAKERGILEHDVATIDLRIADRIAIEPRALPDDENPASGPQGKKKP